VVAALAVTVGVGPRVLSEAPPSPPPAERTQSPTDTIWTCPVHAVVAEKDPGKCPICRRELILVNVSVSWICPDHPTVERTAPGRCADGSPAEPKYTQQAHANHSPRHGGLFFMAPDNWHHLEGTLSKDGMFRVYLYDDYTKPLSLELMKGITGRVVIKESFVAATRQTKELASAALKIGPGGEYLEARIDQAAVPMEMSAKLQFTGDTPEYRFDFAFTRYAEDQVVASSDAILFEIPDNAADVLALFNERLKLIGDLVAKGSFGEVWVPALQAKDLALALDVRTRELPARQRSSATGSVERLVRAAWLLDEYGDLGNREQVEGTFAAFAAAAHEVQSAFAPLAARERRP